MCTCPPGPGSADLPPLCPLDDLADRHLLGTPGVSTPKCFTALGNHCPVGEGEAKKGVGGGVRWRRRRGLWSCCQHGAEGNMNGQKIQMEKQRKGSWGERGRVGSQCGA